MSRAESRLWGAALAAWCGACLGAGLRPGNAWCGVLLPPLIWAWQHCRAHRAVGGGAADAPANREVASGSRAVTFLALVAVWAGLAVPAARSFPPIAAPAPELEGRLTDLHWQRSAVVCTVQPDVGEAVTIHIPLAHDPHLDRPPEGFALGARIRVRVVRSGEESALLRGTALAAVDVVGLRSPWQRWWRISGEVREWFAQRAASRLCDGGDDAPGHLLLALVAGRDEDLSLLARRDLRASGLMHLAVVSGSNVTLLALVAIWVAAPLAAQGSRRRRAVALLAALATPLAWPADPPVRRAALALALARAGQLGGRGASARAALAVAVLLLLGLDPPLARSLSFQLTVCATAALLTPAHRTGWWGRLQLLSAPTAATWPLLVFVTGRVTPWTLAANAAAIPFAAPAVVAGWIAVGWPGHDDLVLQVALAVARAGASVVLAIAHEVALWPGSGSVAAPTSVPWVLVCLASVAVWLSRATIAARRWALVWVIALEAWPLRPSAPVPGRTGAGLEALDVGQGQAVLAYSAQTAVIIDTGDPRRPREHTLVELLRRRGVRRLDALFLTHGDADHCGAGWEALLALRPGRVIVPAAGAGVESLQGLVAAAAEQGIATSFWSEGDRWRVGALEVRALGPPPGVTDGTNDGSLILAVRTGDVTALVTGDASARVEERLAQRNMLALCDVLVAGHHGSRSATSAALLRSVRPRLACVSCGRASPYGHPHPETLRRLAAQGIPVFVTARAGSVRVTAERGRLVVEPGASR